MIKTGLIETDIVDRQQVFFNVLGVCWAYYNKQELADHQILKQIKYLYSVNHAMFVEKIFALLVNKFIYMSSSIMIRLDNTKPERDQVNCIQFDADTYNIRDNRIVSSSRYIDVNITSDFQSCYVQKHFNANCFHHQEYTGNLFDVNDQDMLNSVFNYKEFKRFLTGINND